MVTLSSGPIWRLIVDAAGPTWAEGVVAAGVAREATLRAGVGLEVTAVPWAARMDCAWALTAAAGELVAADRPAFAGVGLTMALPGLVVVVPAEVVVGVLAGRGRRWWAGRVEVRLG